MRTRQSQRGFLLIVAVVLIVVVAFMAVAIVTLTAGSGQAGGAHVASTEALYVAESGLEFEQRCLAQNVDWYRSSADPIISASPCDTAPTVRSVGQGSFSVYANLPATELTRRMTSAATTANVFAASGARWTAPGGAAVTRLLVVNSTFDFSVYTDSISGPGSNVLEFMTYNNAGWTATSFPVTRHVTINTTVNGGATAGTFSRGDYVYPVAQLGAALAANCAPTSITINNDNGKFLDSGTITVFHQTALSTPSAMTAEQITYSSSTVSGTTRTLQGVQRCQNGSSAITAFANDPVAPVVFGTTSAVTAYDLEAGVTSTGNVGSAIRKEYKTVQQ